MRTYRAVIGDGSVVSTTSHPDSEPEKHALFAPFDHPPGLLTGTLTTARASVVPEKHASPASPAHPS